MSDGPATPQDFSFAARDVILNMTLIESLGFGLYSAVFWFTMYHLVFRPRTGASSRASTLVVVTTMYILAAIHLFTRWFVARQAFVVHGETAESILDGFLDQPHWCLTASVISFSLMTLLADFVTVWRCWMIWNRDWKVAAVPLLLVISGTAFCVMAVFYQMDPNSALPTSHFNRFAKFGMIYFVFSLASMALSTALMVYRIASMARITGFNLESPYRKILEILTESAALYCVALIVYLPFLVRDDFSSGYSEAVLNTITGIAPTIIAGRVALGVARDYSTMQQSRNISTLMFATIQTSTSAGASNMIPNSNDSVDIMNLSSQKSKEKHLNVV